jgi:phosphate transport system ATP-binding protein
MNAVELINFSAGYGRKDVLRTVNIGFKSNAISAIVGPSGCGKTTLLRSINRTAELERGYNCHGDIRIFAQSVMDVKNVSNVRRQVGMVYQTPVALPLSTKENVLFGPRYYGGKSNAEMDAIVEDCLHRVALWDEVKDRLNQSASQLSGGQKQRLAIARALAVEPQVLLLDEPCSSLDPASTGLIEELLKELAVGLCVIIVTHNLFQARRIADETVFMMDGQMIEKGLTSKLFISPSDEKTRSFFSGLVG